MATIRADDDLQPSARRDLGEPGAANRREVLLAALAMAVAILVIAASLAAP